MVIYWRAFAGGLGSSGAPEVRPIMPVKQLTANNTGNREVFVFI